METGNTDRASTTDRFQEWMDFDISPYALVELIRLVKRLANRKLYKNVSTDSYMDVTSSWVTLAGLLASSLRRASI